MNDKLSELLGAIQGFLKWIMDEMDQEDLMDARDAAADLDGRIDTYVAEDEEDD